MTKADDFPRDILEEIRAGRVTPEEASQIFDDLIDAIHAGERDTSWAKALGLTIEEATVPLHGRPWSEAVAMREASVRSGRPVSDLGTDYAAASAEWTDDGEAEAWDATISDGLRNDPSG
jgi:hypothetical protein